MSQLHALLTAVHRPYAAVYADSTERLAATGFVRALGGGTVAFASEDLYKIVLQLDNATEWILTAITPTWVQIGGAGLAPASHAASHQNGGSDEINVAGLSGVLADPQVADKVKESSGPTTLTVGAVADGEFLKRNGATVIGATAGAGGLGDVVGPASATDEAIARFDSTTGKLLQDSPVTINNDGAITVPEIAAPSTPAAGKVVIYAKSDNKVYRKGEDGVESELGGGGGTNPTTTLIPYNNAGTLADSYLSHVTGSTQTQSAQHIALTNGKALWFSTAQDFGGLIASGKGAVKVVQDNSLDPGTILSNFQTAMPETPTHTIHPWSSEGMNFRHVLDGNTTIGNPGNHGGDGVAPSGYRFLLMLVQDGTGGHTVTWGSDYKFEGGVAPTMTAAANAKDIYEFICFGDIADCIHISQDVK